MKISGVVITYNEEHNIERCLQSLKGIVDEIVVVDSFSTDATESICNKFNTVFVKNKFEGHVPQKNFALNLAQNEWVLSLDADEVLSEALIKSITDIKKSNSSQKDGYFFNRLTSYAGQWIYHCGWYPDKKIRLFKKEKAMWGGDNPHDKIIMNEGTSISEINGDLLHYSYRSISEHVIQTDKFAQISAKVQYERGRRVSLIQVILRPPLQFIRDYFFKRGFLDGLAGYAICCINALSVFIKYLNIYSLQKNLNLFRNS